LSQIIERLNDLFAGEGLTDADLINYARKVSDKVRENTRVMSQIANNTREQAMLGDFETALQDAILDSDAAQQKQTNRLLSMPNKLSLFKNIIYELLHADRN
jgi:type I restriction enzyme R subunit